MHAMLDSPPVRMGIFLLASALLLGIGVRVLTAGSASEPASAPPAGAIAPQAPTQQGEPLPQGEGTESAGPRQSTIPQDKVVKFLNAYNTVSWQESPTDFTARVVAAGAFAGSQASQFPADDDWLTVCVQQKCSTTVEKVDEVGTTDAGEVKARVQVKYTVSGVAVAYTLYCTLTPVGASARTEGVFARAICPGPEG